MVLAHRLGATQIRADSATGARFGQFDHVRSGMPGRIDQEYLILTGTDEVRMAIDAGTGDPSSGFLDN
jgi:hypothetical protein